MTTPVYPPRGIFPNMLKSGVSPQMSAPSVTDSSRERNRMILRNVWQTAPEGTLNNSKYRGKWRNGAFRVLNNAGDVLSRENYSCGGPNMVGSHFGMLNLTYGGGQSKKNCDKSGVPPSTCNVKYVYDSSDFTKFKKLMALNKGYVTPNYSDGGASSNYSMMLNQPPCSRSCKNKNEKVVYSYDKTFGF